MAALCAAAQSGAMAKHYRTVICSGLERGQGAGQRWMLDWAGDGKRAGGDAA
ncbi:hypothetical protein [Pseudogemmobacter sp. W21_MBD1_M6]|uniref:hypothetical protein n=1 Tax=Pseudogemmobacter sp. W21_MBD1_M6 TaxID=3240271 RepID=UPI003F94B1A2